MNSNVRGRRSIRLKGWDYASPGWYFVTLCAQNRNCLFGEIENGIMTMNDAGNILKNEWQNLRYRFDYLEFDEYIIMPNHFHAILQIKRRGESCIRPEHCLRSIKSGRSQGSIGRSQGSIGRSQGSPLQTKSSVSDDSRNHPYGTELKSLGRIIQAFKSITTHSYIQVVKDYDLKPFQKRLWQRNYFEHIIRSDKELDKIRQYIRDNPVAWPLDDENPEKQFSIKDEKKQNEICSCYSER